MTAPLQDPRFPGCPICGHTVGSHFHPAPGGAQEPADPPRLELIHVCLAGDSAATLCCNRSPFDLPRTDRLTLDETAANCRPVDPSWLMEARGEFYSRFDGDDASYHDIDSALRAALSIIRVGIEAELRDEIVQKIETLQGVPMMGAARWVARCVRMWGLS